MRAFWWAGFGCVMLGGVSLWLLHAPAWAAAVCLVVYGVGVQVRAERRT